MHRNAGAWAAVGWLVALAVVILAVLGWAWVSPMLQSTAAAAWVGALGSVAAVVGAVGIYWRTTTEQTRQTVNALKAFCGAVYVFACGMQEAALRSDLDTIASGPLMAQDIVSLGQSISIERLPSNLHSMFILMRSLARQAEVIAERMHRSGLLASDHYDEMTSLAVAVAALKDGADW